MEEKLHGIVTKGIGGLYGVRLMNRDVSCRARGRFRSEGISPLPGDDVILLPDGDEYVIDEILPRRSELIRPATANLTHLFLLLPACRPKPDLLTADKITSIAENAKIETVVVVGKSDLDHENAALVAEIYKSAGYNVFTLSSVTGEGVTELKKFIDSEAARGGASGVPMRAAFAGVSGAGKSTLIGTLFPDLKLATGDVSRKTERGRHTTRAVELFTLTGESESEFYLADTPGFSMIDFTRFNFFPAELLADNFREFSECLGKCRYTKCTHTKEEGCAVLEKMARGEVHPSRHEGYVTIFEELKRKPEWKRRREEAEKTHGRSK